jgi:sulfide dehydrogenase [flavocytochrome c] flavoprotein subunit
MIFLKRRNFNKLLATTFVSAFVSCTSSGNVINLKNRKRVVVVGGGFGGATVAKYLRKFDSSIEVVLIQKEDTYYTCPASNTVLGGLKDMSFITRDYDELIDNYNIKVIYKVAKKIDGKNHQVILEDGDKISYDRVVVSPGIDLKYEKGYSKKDEQNIPHAYHAGKQTEILRKQLENMKNGDTFVMVAPQNPFRCPPGPYERVSLIANYFKKYKSKCKIIILDNKNKFSKQPLFEQAWEEEYGYGEGEMIEWRSAEFGGEVKKIDTQKKIIYNVDDEEIKADVINYIPNQKAGKIAFDSKLTKGDWCPINPYTFESKLVKDVHIIGDACIAGKMPKSAFAASSQAKVTALQIVGLLNHRKITKNIKLANTCYSMINLDYGIYVTAVYKSNKKTIYRVKGSGATSSIDADRHTKMLNAHYALNWYINQANDAFS